MRRSPIAAMLFLCLLVLAGCSGGGGGTSTTSTVVSGVASKGIIRNGNIDVFALNADGSKGALLRRTVTDNNGAYRADLGGYSGPVVIEATGSYTDEITGGPVTVSSNAPLRAVVYTAAGETTAAVTPLTELAVQRIEDYAGRISVADIAASNAAVAAAFKVDILKTLPVDPTVAGSKADDTQKVHALVLAAFAQLMHKEGKDLASVLAEVKSSIGVDSRMAGPVAVAFKSALADFAASGNNRTGINDLSSTAVAAIGQGSRNLAVSATGADSLSGAEFLIVLPAGVTVDADAAGKVAGAALKAPAGVTAAGYYTPPAGSAPGTVRVVLASGTAFPAQQLLTLQCLLGAQANPADPDFRFYPIVAYDSYLNSVTSILKLSGSLGE